MREAVVVLIDEAHRHVMPAVVTELEHAGMQVDAALDELGMVIGTVLPEDRAKLASVTGVSGVEASETLAVPPPDSDLQ